MTAIRSMTWRPRFWPAVLRPSRELPYADPLVFHIALATSQNRRYWQKRDAPALLSRMIQAVKEMNDGSRKAIRLIHLEPTDRPKPATGHPADVHARTTR